MVVSVVALFVRVRLWTVFCPEVGFDVDATNARTDPKRPATANKPIKSRFIVFCLSWLC